MAQAFDTEPYYHLNVHTLLKIFTILVILITMVLYNIIGVNLMNKLGTDVFTNFQQANHQMGRQGEQVHVLLLGKCGVGKSSLVNNLCGSNVQTGVCPKSLTVILDQISSSYIEQLQLCDAPGVSSEDQNSSLIIRRAIRHLPWNLVIIQTKLDARFQYNTLPELKRLARLFKEDANRIIFMVSCIDKQKQGQERDILLENFKRSLEKYSFTQKLILFSNESSDFELISRIVYDQCCRTNKKILSFDDEKLSIQLGIEECEDQFKEKQNQTRDELINQINKLMPGQNRKGVKYHSIQKKNRVVERTQKEFDLKTNKRIIRVPENGVKRAKELIQKEFKQKNKKSDEKLAEEMERKGKERKQKERKQEEERKRIEQIKNQLYLKNKQEFERSQQQKLLNEAKKQQRIRTGELNVKARQVDFRKQNEKTMQEYIAFQQRIPKLKR